MNAKNTEEFLHAAAPVSVTCLGVPLRPLSLGSLLLLMRFKNTFLLGPSAEIAQFAPISEAKPVGDLLMGIVICSMEYDAARTALADPDLTKDIKLWRRKLDGPAWRRFVGRKNAVPLDQRIKEASKIFREYLAEGLKYPNTKAEAGPYRPTGSPWPLFTLTSLLEDLHIDLKTALNQPLPFSRWLVAGNGERKGLLEISDRQEINDLQNEADAIAREVFGETHAPETQS